MKDYAIMPVADLNGNAGSLGPGEREQRYRPYIEKQRLSRPDAGQAQRNTGGCDGTN